jgi:dicarboxylate transporter 10
MNSSQLVSYDIFKSLILSNSLMSDGMPLHFVASALAGTVATTVSAPADVVRSRIMNAHGNQGLIELITTSIRKEGESSCIR